MRECEGYCASRRRQDFCWVYAAVNDPGDAPLEKMNVIRWWLALHSMVSTSVSDPKQLETPRNLFIRLNIIRRLWMLDRHPSAGAGSA